MDDAHWQLPSLKGTVHIGSLTRSSKLASSQFYDVEFYPYTLPGVDPVFAICGEKFTMVCRCVLKKDGCIEFLRWFENKGKGGPNGLATRLSGRYNSLVWSQAQNGDPLVCVTGNIPQITVLNVTSGQLVQTLSGHGAGINDIAVSPVDPTILASCSTDRSIRIWSLDPKHKERPLAAICYGQNHKDQNLTLAYHRKGRFLLCAGMDTKINLWVIPDHVSNYAGTDKPAMLRHPHFSTAEIHTDFVDCVQWYNDLILSHACRQGKIVLWRIEGFNSDRAKIPPAPVLVSSAVDSRTPVTIPSNSVSSTQSAWGGRFERLLQFDLPHTNQFYIRFSLFHELGRNPVLAAVNEKSEVFFWDLKRLELSGMGQEASQNDNAKGLPWEPPQHVRHASPASNSSSTTSGVSGNTTKMDQKSAKEHVRDRGISDPFHPIKAHKILEIPRKQAFALRHFAWSRDGQWGVAVGDSAQINILHRWEQGVPPPSTDIPADFPQHGPAHEVAPVIDLT